jgi:hypothetical protein
MYCLECFESFLRAEVLDERNCMDGLSYMYICLQYIWTGRACSCLS